MLARVLSLTNKPNELPANRRLLSLDDVSKEAEALLAPETSQGRISALQSELLPGALLDPEMGDESLHIVLLYETIKKIEFEAEAGNRPAVERLLRAVVLLQGIHYRKLHKVCTTIDAEQFARLRIGSKTEGRDEEVLIRAILNLREGEHGAKERERLEQQMCKAANYPLDSFIIYVPDRKTQAKGIETGALENGDVVCLGMHSAVRAQVEDLSKKYMSLWRLIVFVAPERASDFVALSRAVDVLVENLIQLSLDDIDRRIEELEKACWFSYIRRERREAAEQAAADLSGAVDWNLFQAADHTLAPEHSVSPRDYADRALLLHELSRMRVETKSAVQLIRERYVVPESLISKVDGILGSSVAEGKAGIEDTDRRLSVIGDIAQELLSKGTLFEP
jgi:hypothetical protein